jgi:carbohydrate-binding DOMON domain-containing protein
MSTQYRLVQSGKTASGGCSAGQGSSEPVSPRIYLLIFLFQNREKLVNCLKIFFSFLEALRHENNETQGR